MKKKDLAILLSGLRPLSVPNVELEQYLTDSEIAADVLWDAFLRGDVERNVIADFGCGNGILGIGALLLGARKVYFVDVDKRAIALAKENLRFVQECTGKNYVASFFLQDITAFSHRVDVVLQNPPFGVQQEHADKLFLEQAMIVADVVYTIHKVESKTFIASLARDHGFRVTFFTKTLFPLKKTQAFHTQKIYKVPVGIWRLERYRKV